MNFGQNLYNWFLSNAQSLVLLPTVALKSACVGLSVSHGRECLSQPASG